MTTLPRLLSLPVLAATLLLGTSAVRAAGGIQDDGAFFSEFAKVNASGTIKDVSTRLHKDISVQTFAAVPEDMKAKVLQGDKAATNRGFSQWAEQLARSKSVNGVFILLVKQPAHLQVVVGNDTQRQAFTLLDRQTLVERMIKQLRDKKNDEALIDGVNFIATTMTSHRSGSAAPTTSHYRSSSVQPTTGSSWLGPILGFVVILVVINVIRSLFRAMSGGGGGTMNGGMGQPYNVGGGGFFQNMMSSMFGAAAGMWMYDTFFGGHSNAATFNDQHRSDFGSSDGGFGGGGGYSGTDTDYSSSGDSFGGDSGGGGDFGGGDSGGGGDF
ncbi:hypothetical protein [Prosthecobacter sp.]|uniref:hypothetical protein n=1 Tax=Prosthecobacter sp. TaxID=1965333 RepID=UPI0037839CE3